MEKYLSKIKQFWNEIKPTEPWKENSIFHFARLKLTGFYLAAIIAISLLLTISLRTLAEIKFDNVGSAQRGIVHHLFLNLYSVPPKQDNTFGQFQNQQEESFRDSLNEDVLIINLFALVGGGILSYWYAGRTLKPIAKAHETQARFAADASHELRTPLASLRVENEVFLRKKNFGQSEARQLINSNLEEVQRLENLAYSLLALSQYESASLELSNIDILSLVNKAIDQTKSTAKTKGIDFDIKVLDQKIVGNAESLIQLFAIVLDNAVKYSPAKGTVFIDGVLDGSRYHVSVRDQGKGIADDDLPHIFERLYRGDKSRSDQIPGYGLGLALAEEIADANRSNITARNYPSGVGAQFVISLNTAKNK